MRPFGTLPVALMLVLVAGCTEGDGQAEPTGSAGDCVADLLFGGLTYDANMIRSDGFTQPVGRLLGTGESVDCDDGREPLGEKTRVFELKGVEPALAVAVPAGRGTAPRKQFAVMTPAD